MLTSARRFALVWMASPLLAASLAACGSDLSEPRGLPVLRVIVETDGVDVDSDGYRLVVGSRSPILTHVSDTVVVEGLEEDPLSIRLDGLEVNCAVAGENPIRLDIGSIAHEVRFDVACIRSEGDLQLNIDVAGPVGDPSGFAVSVDGRLAPVVGASDTLVFSGVRGGVTEIRFEKLASYCSAGDSTEVVVRPAARTTVDLTVSCDYSVRGRLLFSVSTDEGYRLHTVAPDGGDLVPFGDHDEVDGDQLRSSISADGTRIVFMNRTREFFTIGPDGRNLGPIPHLSGTTPKISPDGERIAYSNSGECWVANFDGTNRIQITEEDLGFCHSPDWSPDGRRLAFEVETDSDWTLYTSNPDGSGLRRITVDAVGDDLDPDYHPGGDRLAFHTKRNGPKIVTSTLSGGSLVEVADVGWDPVWSPDGGRIAYHTDPPYALGLYVVDVSTGDVTLLSATLPGVHAVHAAWGPPL